MFVIFMKPVLGTFRKPLKKASTEWMGIWVTHLLKVISYVKTQRELDLLQVKRKFIVFAHGPVCVTWYFFLSIEQKVALSQV